MAGHRAPSATSLHYRWNPQAFAGAGYAVVTVDFHGSTGYGQAFTDAISGDWGGKPLVDLKEGLAAALRLYPWIDGDRACALGGSYGGFMATWIAGNRPDRFRCLVDHDGIFDQRIIENHWVLRPANSILWHDTVLAWLARWLRPAGEAGRN